MSANPNWNRLTVLQLRGECRQRNLSDKGLKASLVQRLTNYTEEQSKDVDAEGSTPVVSGNEDEGISADEGIEDYTDETEAQLVEESQTNETETQIEESQPDEVGGSEINMTKPDHTEKNETEVHQTETEVKQTETEVHQTETEVKQTETKQTETEVKQTETKQTETEVKQTETGVNQTETEVNQTETEVNQTQTEVNQTDDSCMEESEQVEKQEEMLEQTTNMTEKEGSRETVVEDPSNFGKTNEEEKEDVSKEIEMVVSTESVKTNEEEKEEEHKETELVDPGKVNESKGAELVGSACSGQTNEEGKEKECKETELSLVGSTDSGKVDEQGRHEERKEEKIADSAYTIKGDEPAPSAETIIDAVSSVVDDAGDSSKIVSVEISGATVKDVQGSQLDGDVITAESDQIGDTNAEAYQNDEQNAAADNNQVDETGNSISKENVEMVELENTEGDQVDENADEDIPDEDQDGSDDDNVGELEGDMITIDFVGTVQDEDGDGEDVDYITTDVLEGQDLDGEENLGDVAAEAGKSSHEIIGDGADSGIEYLGQTAGEEAYPQMEGQVQISGGAETEIGQGQTSGEKVVDTECQGQISGEGDDSKMKGQGQTSRGGAYTKVAVQDSSVEEGIFIKVKDNLDFADFKQYAKERLQAHDMSSLFIAPVLKEDLRNMELLQVLDDSAHYVFNSFNMGRHRLNKLGCIEVTYSSAKEASEAYEKLKKVKFPKHNTEVYRKQEKDTYSDLRTKYVFSFFGKKNPFRGGGNKKTKYLQPTNCIFRREKGQNARALHARRTLVIYGLPKDFTEQDVRSMFREQAKNIDSVCLALNKCKSGKIERKEYIYVSFKDFAECENARQYLHRKSLDGKKFIKAYIVDEKAVAEVERKLPHPQHQPSRVLPPKKGVPPPAVMGRPQHSKGGPPQPRGRQFPPPVQLQASRGRKRTRTMSDSERHFRTAQPATSPRNYPGMMSSHGYQGREETMGGNRGFMYDNPSYMDGQGMMGGNQGMMGSNQGMMGDNRGMMGDNRGMMGCNQAMMGGNQPMMGGNQAMMGGNQAMMGGNQGIPSNQSGTDAAAAVNLLVGLSKMLSEQLKQDGSQLNQMGSSTLRDYDQGHQQRPDGGRKRTLSGGYYTDPDPKRPYQPSGGRY